MKDYFELYPEELDGMSDSLLPMLVESKLWKRDYENLKDCVADDYIKEDDVLVINDMLVLIFQSLIIQASQVENIDIKAQVVKMLDYVERIFNAHRMDEK